MCVGGDVGTYFTGSSTQIGHDTSSSPTHAGTFQKFLAALCLVANKTATEPLYWIKQLPHAWVQTVLPSTVHVIHPAFRTVAAQTSLFQTTLLVGTEQPSDGTRSSSRT